MAFEEDIAAGEARYRANETSVREFDRQRAGSADGHADERGLTIKTRYDATRDLLIATVEDTGEGIPAGDFKRLFQPYFSTRGRGTGLGLAIVARIVTEHGGRVYAEANVPHGARFVIELPTASG